MARKLLTTAPNFALFGLAVLLVVAPGAVLAQWAPVDSAGRSSGQAQAQAQTVAARQPDRGRGIPCAKFPGGAAFIDKIDNPYLPLEPGTTYTYRASDGERTVVEVTNQTKQIIGVTTRVVRDTVSDGGGVLVEDTLDWFAQDQAGNVWYFGEDVKNYENGVLVDTEGSWEAGVAGAEPGIAMQGRLRPGQKYAQECAPGVAEDKAQVLRLGQSLAVPYGSFDNVLVTKEWNSLDPKPVEHKFYAPCVGLIRELEVRGGDEETVLIDVQGGISAASAQRCGAALRR